LDYLLKITIVIKEVDTCFTLKIYRSKFSVFYTFYSLFKEPEKIWIRFFRVNPLFIKAYPKKPVFKSVNYFKSVYTLNFRGNLRWT